MNAFVVGLMIPVVVIVLVMVWGFATGLWHGSRNRAEGVIAEWARLRITPTELILGYGKNALRFPLAGLSAKVEGSGAQARSGRLGGNDNRRIHVIIEGPGTAIVRTKKARATYNGDAQARQFAATLNMASRQLEQQ